MSAPGVRAEAARLAAQNDELREAAGNHRAPWTQAEVDLILQSPKTAAELAVELGRTAWAVRDRRRMMGWRARRPAAVHQ